MTEIEKLFKNANIKQDRMCEWTCKDIADLYDDSEYAKQVKKIIQREN